MKTINEINAEIDNSYQTAFELDGTQLSNATEWKLFRGVFAQLVYSIYQFFDGYKAEVSALAATAEFGNSSWWHSVMLAFQEGYSLTVNKGAVTYATINEAAQIIKRVAITELLGANGLIVQIKVAKETAGVPEPLSAPQLVQVESYVKAYKSAGVLTQVISVAADEVKTTETIYYDGKLTLSAIQTAVMNARKAYLANIVFNGEFNINRYRDALEQLPGVIDTDIAGVSIKPFGGSYVTVARTYTPLSGYYKIIEADCTINFIAQ